MKKLLTVWSILLVVVMMLACAFAEEDGGVVTDHGDIKATEFYKNAQQIPEDKVCHYSPVIARVFYDDGYYEDVVRIFEHEWVLQKDTATCTEPGVATYKCSVCGDVKEEASKALGHLWSSEVDGEEWGRIIEEADCTKTGLAEDYCVREGCGVKGEKTRVIESPDHVFVTGNVLDSKPHCYNEDLDGKLADELLYTETSADGVEVTFVYGWYHKEDVCKFCGLTKKVADSDTKIKVDEYNELFVKKTADYIDGHEWDKWVTEIPAKCDKDGKDVRWCIHCGVEEYRITPAFHHSKNAPDFDDMGWLKKTGTHITDCFTRYDEFVCEKCGEEFKGMFIDGVFQEGTEFKTESHMYPTAVEAVVKAGGIIDVETYEAWQKDKAIKDYIDAKVDPNCITDGSITIKCIFADTVSGHDDDDKVTVTVSKLGHLWSEWVNEHPVGQNGNVYGHWVRTCLRCTSEDDEKLQKLYGLYGCKHMTMDFNGSYSPEACEDGKHIYEVISTTDATCTTDGEIFSICKVCGAEDKKVIPATGHTWGDEVVTAATCTEDGIITKTCTVCGVTETTAGDKATGHKFNDGEVVVEATCANGGVDGKILYTCTLCGLLKTETVPAPEHKIVEDPAVEATVGTPGKTAGSHCEVCGEIIVAQEEIPAIVENTYDIDLSDVTVDGTTSGNGVIKVTGGNQEVPALYARITWAYELSDGSTMAYVAIKPVTSADDTLTFKTKSPTLPNGATLTGMQIALVTDPDADEAAYTGLAFAKK